ncbi:MAG: glycosyl hydrolase 115 family protein [Muribaculaceae bacterium]|nr:glycosyl hydrolase 115 family protein [Muribaculaceae bacterium]
MKKNLIPHVFVWALLLIASSLSPAIGNAKDILQVFDSSNADAQSFRIKGAPIVYDKDDYPVVRNAVKMLGEDICMVTGEDPKIKADTKLPTYDAIIVGTLGKSKLIDKLASMGYIPADSIKGEWERYLIWNVKYKKGKKFLVIAGSDRRGTAYGVTSLSESMGVNPWVWWADIPVPYRPDIGVKADYISAPPSVKYRGIFINDEDWGMLPWSAQGLDKDINDIGPNTYEKVCRLLLRLKGNMLAPAMHSCTGAFYSHPDSKVVADQYGIIITTSHCEPMLFNNAAKSEWDNDIDGVWDYGLNGETIRKKFHDRLEEASPYENLYTIGMRGLHDEAMSRSRPLEEKLDLLHQVIDYQRGLLSSKFNCPAEEVPQIFVPYKETLDLYRKGLEIPDDVTIVWPDDNYGYMKGLSNPEERKRKGGSGVYYHTSYLGTPHDYLWLCTTPPALMYHELRKAWNTGSDRYWLLNVGDIKPAELDMQTFFEMAWDIDKFDYSNINYHQPEWLASIFGDQYKDDFKKIMDEYYRLAWIRKPEYMGWELEWDDPRRADTGPTDFSFSNYADAVKRIDDYERLAANTRRIIDALPDSLSIPFFEMVGYPVLASEMMTRKYLFSQLNGEFNKAGEYKKANYAARLSEQAADSIRSLTEEYNSLCDGKWKGMMAVPPGFCANYQNDAHLVVNPGVGEEAFILSLPADSKEIACRTLDLRKPKANKSADIVEGMGYDGFVLKLGSQEAKYATVPEVVYDLGNLKGDSVTLQIFHLPFFPIYDGERCRFSVSVDDGEEQILEYIPEEWSSQWKENVLRNSALSFVAFPLSPNSDIHTMKIRSIDPGLVIQRIVVDEGGFRPGYVGPDL